MADRRRTVYLDDRVLGAYVADVRVSELAKDPETYEFTMTLDDLYTLRLHVDNAIQGLENRKTIDALCGDCDECSNTRMINIERPGRMTPWTEHCPVCYPKTTAWAAKVAAL